MLTGSFPCTEMGKAQTASMHCKQQEVDFNSRTLCWNMMSSLTPISGTIVLAASLFKVHSALLTSQQHYRVTLVCWWRKDGGVKSSEPGTKCYRTFINSSLSYKLVWKRSASGMDGVSRVCENAKLCSLSWRTMKPKERSAAPSAIKK